MKDTLQDAFIPKMIWSELFPNAANITSSIRRVGIALNTWECCLSLKLSGSFIVSPWQPSFVSSSWPPGPSPSPASPSWSPGWRRSSGAQRTSASSLCCDIRTAVSKTLLEQSTGIFQISTFNPALDSDQGKREKRFLTAVLILVVWSLCWTLCEWGKFLRMQLRLILSVVMKLLVTNASFFPEYGDWRLQAVDCSS